MQIDCNTKLYIEIHFWDIVPILSLLDVYTLVSYRDTAKELCAEAIINKNTDKAKYYHCLARLLELNIMTHKVEEIL